MGQYNVYYMRPEWFANGICGKKPDLSKLNETHVLLKTVEVEGVGQNALDVVYLNMQAENWSPNGEARDLIKSKGLRHTSMSVGDVIERDGLFWVVGGIGFNAL